jgi:hypothetical protein
VEEHFEGFPATIDLDQNSQIVYRNHMKTGALAHLTCAQDRAQPLAE